MLLEIDTMNSAWYEMNTGSVIAAAAYLLVAVSLMLWPTRG